MKTDAGFAVGLIERATKGGASEAEVYMRTARKLSVEVKRSALDAVESARSFGYSLRLIKDGRQGFSYSTDMDEAETVIEAALQSARFTEHDEFLTMPGPYVPETPDVFDPALDEITEEQALQYACQVEAGALEADERMKKVRKATAAFITGETLVVNSNGVFLSYPCTAATAHVMAVAEDGSDSQMGWGFEGGRHLSVVPFREAGTRAAERALMMLGAGKLEPRKAHVLLDGEVAAEFLGIFSSLLSSESVQKGKSILKGRLGETVLSECINIVDDGLLDHRLGSGPVDDEGYPTSRKVLVEKGVLKGFMYNSYTAKKDGLSSTGNAVRAGIEGVPGVGPTNIFIEGCSTSPVDGLIKEADGGIYVVEAMGVHMANPISGEFSIGVSGLLIEDGRLGRPVKEAVVSGNILDFFKRVVAAGDDLRFYGAAGSPSLLVEGIDISG